MDAISTPQQCFEIALLALCIWREARGEPLDAKQAVAWAIRNRVTNPSWWGNSWQSVILKPWQFSSFNAGDPNAVKWPQETDSSWQASLGFANDVWHGTGVDPTGGATHYFDNSLDNHPPGWATDGSMQHCADIGALRFYRRTA